MGLFNEERVKVKGLTLLELSLLGLTTAVVWVISSVTSSIIFGEVSFKWQFMYDAFGIACGVPLIGVIVSKLGLGVYGQYFGIVFVIAGFGQVITLAFQQIASTFILMYF